MLGFWYLILDTDAQDSSRGLDWNDLSKYTFEEKEVISHDGVRIPMSILYSRVAYKTGQSPGLLHAYGAYGEVLDKGWCSDRLSLLDRGWLFAFADVRYVSYLIIHFSIEYTTQDPISTYVQGWCWSRSFVA